MEETRELLEKIMRGSWPLGLAWEEGRKNWAVQHAGRAVGPGLHRPWASLIGLATAGNRFGHQIWELGRAYWARPKACDGFSKKIGMGGLQWA